MRTWTQRGAASGALIALISVWLAAAAQPLSAAEETKSPSAAKGRELAERLCMGCHLIGSEGGNTAQVGPPSFPSIANRPGQTAEQIKSALVQPHSPMPDTHLTNEEILNIIAYLDSLRVDKTAPSLLPSGETGKPKLPAPT